MKQDVSKMLFSHTESSFLVKFTLVCVFCKTGKKEVESSVDFRMKSLFESSFSSRSGVKNSAHK